MHSQFEGLLPLLALEQL